MSKRNRVKSAGKIIATERIDKENVKMLFNTINYYLHRFFILIDNPENQLIENRYNYRIILSSILKLIQFLNVIKFGISALFNKVSHLSI